MSAILTLTRMRAIFLASVITQQLILYLRTPCVGSGLEYKQATRAVHVHGIGYIVLRIV